MRTYKTTFGLTLLVAASLAMPAGAVDYLYDFEGLNSSATPGVDLNGQDNWVQTTGLTHMSGVVNDVSAGGFSGNSLVKVDSTAGALNRFSRENDSNFGFDIPDGSKFTFEFDAQAGKDAQIYAGMISPTSTNWSFLIGTNTSNGWRFRTDNPPNESTTSLNLYPGDEGPWQYHILLDVDLAANGGNGSASLFVRDDSGGGGPVVLTAVPDMQNMNMGLGAVDGSDFNGLSIYIVANDENVPAGIDNILITVIPEPASLALLGLGGLLILRRRRSMNG